MIHSTLLERGLLCPVREFHKNKEKVEKEKKEEKQEKQAKEAARVTATESRASFELILRSLESRSFLFPSSKTGPGRPAWIISLHQLRIFDKDSQLEKLKTGM